MSCDPFTLASPQYRQAMKTNTGRSTALEVYSPGRVLSVFGRGAAFFAVLGLIAGMIWVGFA